MKVTLSGKSHEVVFPRSHALKTMVAQGCHENPQLGAFALLAACVPSLKVKASLRAARHDVLAWGMDVWDETGLDAVEVMNAVYPVVEALVADLFPGDQEVEEHADFSEAPADS